MLKHFKAATAFCFDYVLVFSEGRDRVRVISISHAGRLVFVGEKVPELQSWLAIFRTRLRFFFFFLHG